MIMDNSIGRLEIELKTLEDTSKLGRILGELAEPGDVILLKGPLGAGKTTLTQWIAQGLGVPEEYYVTSPSYNLVHEYPGRLPLYHIDCYRLESEEDVENVGLLDYLPSRAGLSVVEWPQRLGALTPRTHLELVLTPEADNDRRLVVLTCHRIRRDRLDKIAGIF